ncbi:MULTISPECIES: hypothetical protein [Helicobacter]|uniref:Uncharacterized protein n=1 Tax=Helicobacter bilis ATCC 43879 TaxID=613026 RepID=C3XIX1_9HELI|nr:MULTISPECIES: hypothetical protein [Helicobacter]EEO24960.1 hypothetical protein HRAG_02017 [Helicobacter bilis ATCC 43879]
MQKILHTITLYLLRKSVFERIILLCLFVVSCVTLLSYIEYDEWVLTQRKQVDITTMQSNIALLFKDYEITSKCKNAICSNKELKQRRMQTTLPYTTNHYTLFFTCKAMLCYEFIHALEALPTLFIHEISLSNATIRNLDSMPYGWNMGVKAQDSKSLESTNAENLDSIHFAPQSPAPAQVVGNLDSINDMPFTQDIKIVFSVGTYQI